MLHRFARLLLTLFLFAAVAAHADQSAAWAALREGGHIILMRHATAPGVENRPSFRLGDCATQRLLSEAGRRQAKAIGTALRERGVKAGQVLTSAWCRCVWIRPH